MKKINTIAGKYKFPAYLYPDERYTQTAAWAKSWRRFRYVQIKLPTALRLANPSLGSAIRYEQDVLIGKPHFSLQPRLNCAQLRWLWHLWGVCEF